MSRLRAGKQVKLAQLATLWLWCGSSACAALLNGGTSLQSGLVTHADGVENNVVTVRERRVDWHADNAQTMLESAC